MRSRQSLLIPSALRRPALVVVGVCALIIVTLGVHYGGQHRAGRIDFTIDHWSHDLVAGHQTLVNVVASMGSFTPMLFETTTLAVAGYFIGRGAMALLAVLGPTAAITVTETLKHVFGRTINTYLSLPSGHTTALVSMLTVAVVMWLNRRGRGRAVLGGVLAIGFALASLGVAFSLVYRHYHYATDVVAGGCVGLSTVILVTFALERLPRRQ